MSTQDKPSTSPTSLGMNRMTDQVSPPQQERIIGVTVKIGDEIFTLGAPARHPDVLFDFNIASRANGRKIEQGFATNKRRFLTRREAMDVAKASGQFNRRSTVLQYNGPDLYSEDLW